MAQQPPYTPTSPLPTIPVYTQQTDVTGVTGVQHTYQLPGNGFWLINYEAYINADLNNLGTFSEIATFFHGSKNLQTHAGIGGTGPVFASGNTAGFNSMTVANASTTGLITVTLGWTDGLSHPTRLIITARRLADIVSTL